MKILGKMTMALSALALCAACTNEDDVFQREGYSENGLIATIPAYEFDGGTRVSVSDDLQTFTWSDNDMLGIYYSDDNTDAQTGYTVKHGGSSTGEFGNDVFYLNPSKTYYAFYPYNSSFTISAADVDFTGQTQTANASAAHIGAYNYMYGNVSISGGANVNFKNLGAVMQAKIALPAGGTYTSLIIKSGNGVFTTKGTASMQDGTVTSTETCDSLILSFGDGLTLATGDTLTANMLIAPVDMSSSKLTFTLNDESGNSYVFTSDGKAMVAGKAYLYKLAVAIPYVTFSADSQNTFILVEEQCTLQYSVGGSSWKYVDEEEPISYGGDLGDLRLRGKNPTGTAKSTTKYSQIALEGSAAVTISGDIRTLIDYENYETVSTSEALFCHLFDYYSRNATIYASELKLPATELAPYCYQGMFSQCYNLMTAPELPATTLSIGCYMGMFNQCTSLQTAPVLPAETLTAVCYSEMFKNCSNLNYIEMQATDVSASSCLSSWLSGVSSTGTFVKSPSMHVLPNGINGIPIGWTVLPEEVIPYVTFRADAAQTFQLSTYYLNSGEETVSDVNVATLEYSVNDGSWTTLGTSTVSFGGTAGDLKIRGTNLNGTSRGTSTSGTDNVYSRIVFGNSTPVSCSGDIRTLIDYENSYTVSTSQAQFRRLFYGCTQLTSAPELPSTSLADYCYAEMFRGCTSLVEMPELPAMTLAPYSYYRMFYGCTSLATVSNLPATSLSNYCYNYMFYGCSNLAVAPSLPATSLTSHCYEGMFRGCSSLVSAPSLPATTLASNCYDAMFFDCSSMINAPTLPATSLASCCYQAMFQGCSSLTNAPALPATDLVSGCYSSMFRDCTSLTTAPELPATILVSSCYYWMFLGCSNLNYIKMMATDISATVCMDLWVSGVASSGIFVKNPAATWTKTGSSGIPSGWTVQTASE